jgi:DNA-directed RNA polymerase I and III subunit RPAC1
MALDFFTIIINTGVMPDEVLTHRLSLVPLDLNPSQFEFLSEEMTPTTDDDPRTTVLFGLHVIGGEGPEPNLVGLDSSWEERLPPFYTGPSGMVMSCFLVFMPMSGQSEMGEVGPRHGNVPITKLNPGQRIHLYGRAIKGTGALHAKWSPVGTAFYRLVPKVEIASDITEAVAKILVANCPLGVFEIEESGEVVVKNARKCTTCRECTRMRRTRPFVSLGKVANHWEFTVESLGVRTAPELVKEALQILRDKAERMKQAVSDCTLK